MKRFLTLALALLMLMSCFALASCKNDKDKPDDTDEEEYTQPANLNEQLDVPENLNFDDEFKVLGFNGLAPEFGDAELSEPDLVEQSLYERDDFVETYLGIIFDYSQMNGQWNDRHTYADTVYQSVLSNSGAWDLIGTYSMIPASLAIRGVAYYSSSSET